MNIGIYEMFNYLGGPTITQKEILPILKKFYSIKPQFLKNDALSIEDSNRDYAII